MTKDSMDLMELMRKRGLDGEVDFPCDNGRRGFHECEIFALVWQRLAGNFRQSVREAVSEVQSRMVLALAEPPTDLTCNQCLLNR